MYLSAAAAALMLAAPTNSPSRTEETKSVSVDMPANKKSADFAEVMKMFDKLFPPQPDPDPARLAVARQTASGLFPQGVYGRMMTTLIDTMATRFLDMSEADFNAKDSKGKPASTQTMREAIAKDDPHFEERMAIIRRVLGEEMGKVSAILEPRMRDGLARSMARRFDAKQLADLNAFLATDSGKAFGEQNMAMWVDPDIIRGIFGSMPELIAIMPGVMQRIEKETAHLPKPKKGKPAPAKKAS